jgi:NodT family efflux transporter outer membrane factor (OMF) lipoprotein
VKASAQRVHALLPVLLLLSGCLVGRDYEAPQSELPDRWRQELVRGLETGEADLRTWWTALGDPLLDSLIDRAGGANLDLEAAVARIYQARAVRGIARGERAPDVDGTGDVQRTRISDQVTTVPPPPAKRIDTFYSLGGAAFWELDVWGRITRSIESADAALDATIEDYRDVQVSVYAEVAATYVEARALQARLQYALANVETQRTSLKLTQDRLAAGISSELEVAQAQLNLSTTESIVPTLRIGLARAIHALGVLLGEEPTALHAELASSAGIPAPPDRITVGLPAELLRQRPDVRSAERRLASQTARIGVATADLLPQFSLVGTFAVEAFASDSVFDAGSDTYGFGPSLRWNLFDGGRVRNAIALEDARTDEALASYEQTVLRALEDVENSMVSYAQERDRRDLLARSVEAAAKAAELVLMLYRTGLTDFQNVLDMERSLFQQQDDLAESEGLVTQNLISIYRALGGGWDTSQTATAPAP